MTLAHYATTKPVARCDAGTIRRAFARMSPIKSAGPPPAEAQGPPRIVTDKTGYTRYEYPSGRVDVRDYKGDPATLRQWAQATIDIGQNTPDGVTPEDRVKYRTPANVLKYSLNDANRDISNYVSQAYLPNGQVPDQMSTMDKVVLNAPRSLAEFGAGVLSFPSYAAADIGNIGTDEPSTTIRGLGLVGSSGGYSGSLPQRIGNVVNQGVHGNSKPARVMFGQMTDYATRNPVAALATLWSGGEGALSLAKSMGVPALERIAASLETKARWAPTLRERIMYRDAAEKYTVLADRVQALRPPSEALMSPVRKIASRLDKDGPTGPPGVPRTQPSSRPNSKMTEAPGKPGASFDSGKPTSVTGSNPAANSGLLPMHPKTGLKIPGAQFTPSGVPVFQSVGALTKMPGYESSGLPGVDPAFGADASGNSDDLEDVSVGMPANRRDLPANGYGLKLNPRNSPYGLAGNPVFDALSSKDKGAATIDKDNFKVTQKQLYGLAPVVQGTPDEKYWSDGVDDWDRYLKTNPNGVVLLRAGTPVKDLIRGARHEDVHLQQANLGNGSIDNSLDLTTPEGQSYVQHPHYATAKSSLLAKGYKEDDIPIEVPAWIAAGDYGEDGLGLEHSDAQSLLGNYVDALVQQHGPDAAAQVFRRSRAVAKDVVKSKLNPSVSRLGLDSGSGGSMGVTQSDMPSAADEPPD